MLSLGTDLTSLGLNLNSSDSLHKALISPLADIPVKCEWPEWAPIANAEALMLTLWVLSTLVINLNPGCAQALVFSVL